MKQPTAAECRRLAVKIEKLVREMRSVSDLMADLGSGSRELSLHSEEMARAATTAETWAKGVWAIWRDAR